MRRAYVPIRGVGEPFWEDGASFTSVRNDMLLSDIKTEVSSYFSKPSSSSLHILKPFRVFDSLGRDGVNALASNLRKGGFQCYWLLSRHVNPGLNIFVCDPALENSRSSFAYEGANSMAWAEKKDAEEAWTRKIESFRPPTSVSAKGNNVISVLKELVLESVHLTSFSYPYTLESYLDEGLIGELESTDVLSFINFLDSMTVTVKGEWVDKIVDVLWYTNSPSPIDITEKRYVVKITIPDPFVRLGIQLG